MARPPVGPAPGRAPQTLTLPGSRCPHRDRSSRGVPGRDRDRRAVARRPTHPLPTARSGSPLEPTGFARLPERASASGGSRHASRSPPGMHLPREAPTQAPLGNPFGASYRPRRAAETLIHRLIHEHLETPRPDPGARPSRPSLRRARAAAFNGLFGEEVQICWHFPMIPYE